MKFNRRLETDDDAQGGAGAGVSMHAEPLVLPIEDARALLDIARAGGAVTFVERPRSAAVHVMNRLEREGRLEKQPQLSGGVRVRLLPPGVSLLPAAAKLIAAGAEMSR